MHSSEYVLEKARKRYRSVWRDALMGTGSGEYAVALDPPSAAAITDRAGDVSAWLARWRQWAAQYPDVTLRTRTTRTKFGDQPLYTHVDIPDISALAGLNPDTAAHWQRARDRWNRLRRYEPGEAMRPLLARVIDLDDYDFTTLLDAIIWFRAHPRSGLTVRSVPVPGMHTKWLAKHRGMLLACLGTSSDSAQTAEPEGSDPVDIPAADLDALGLRPLPREISVVLADPALRAAVGGLRQITAPVNELAGLRIRPDAVLIVENKEPALSWNDTAGLMIIHSLGNHLDVLSRLPWLQHDRCWYWGDLDRHGFTILSRARAMVPQLESLLMAPDSVETYRSLGIEENLDRYDQPDPTLTPAEASALAGLRLANGKYLRTEQERIPLPDAERALDQVRHRGKR